MAIPEAQLDTWSAIGAQTQSKETHLTIRNALQANDTPYAGSVDIFLQGSYGNDTNVYGKDSDVDIVMKSERAYFRDLSRLNPAQRAMYDAQAGGAPAYPFGAFKADVIKVLQKKFGTDVDTSNKKAIKIKANGTRRSADVLVCQDFRRYFKYNNSPDDYIVGIGFNTTDNRLIENYPKFHSENLTKKHQNTYEWLKPTIRIAKNMRNRLISDGLLQSSVAPSYYIEGLFWNIPNDRFGKNYSTTVFNCLKWISEADESELVCANGMSGLIANNSPIAWSSENFRAFKSQVIELWNQWRN